MRSTYNSRKWLDEESHSGASVQCYYNEECVNHDHQCFIRITDCQNSFVFSVSLPTIYNVRVYIARLSKLTGFLDDVIIDDTKSTLRFGNTRLSNDRLIGNKEVRAKMKEAGWVNGYKLKFLKKDKLRKLRIQHAYTDITLHMDPETCDYAHWIKKISILKNEINDFITFLNRINK